MSLHISLGILDRNSRWIFAGQSFCSALLDRQLTLEPSLLWLRPAVIQEYGTVLTSLNQFLFRLLSSITMLFDPVVLSPSPTFTQGGNAEHLMVSGQIWSLHHLNNLDYNIDILKQFLNSKWILKYKRCTNEFLLLRCIRVVEYVI